MHLDSDAWHIWLSTAVSVQGSESVYGRDLVEEHLDACIAAGLTISGINAEVMPGQWEFQIGPAGPLDMPDEVRYEANLTLSAS